MHSQINNAFIHNEKQLHLPSFPTSIVITYCDFQRNQYQTSLFSNYKIYFPESIQRSVNKRQAEFLAGRYIAMKALNSLDVYTNTIAIGEHRNPVWPQAIIASITHTDTTSICAASFKKKYQYLGIDLETIVTTKTMLEIEDSIIFNHEINILKKSKLNLEEAFTLVFSAKESLFKALYPSVKHYFNFSAAKITTISLENTSFTLELTENLTTELHSGMVFTGYFHCIDEKILTIIVK